MAKSSRKRSRNDNSTAQAGAASIDTEAPQPKAVLGDNVKTLPGSRKKRPPPPPAGNELDLEKLIFGGSSSLLSQPSTSKRTTGEEALEDNDSDDEGNDAAQNQFVADGDLFMVDTAGGDDDGQLEDQQAGRSSGSESEDDDDDDILVDRIATDAASSGPSQTHVKKPKRTKRCVWTDPDDAALTIDLTRRNNLAANGSRVGVSRLRRLREELGEKKISGLEYELRLRAQFEKLHPRPGWASFRLTSLEQQPEEFDITSEAVITNEDASKGIHDLLRSDTGLVEGYGSSNNGLASKSIKARGKLRAGEIELDRLRNANDAQNAHAIAAEESLPGIEMVRFHPSPRASVLMTASRDRRVRLFQIDGKTNPLVQTVHVPDLPITHASFHPSGSSALISGKRPFLYAYDLQAGRVVRSLPWRGAGSLHSQSAEEDTAELHLSDAKFQPHTAEEGNRLLAIGGRRGVVHLLDWGRSGAAGGTRIGGVRMNSPLAGFTWDAASVLGDRGTGIGVTGTGKDVELLTMSTEGSVHLWDIRNMGLEVGCTSIWNDPGSFGAKGLEVSPNGKFWTVGSEGGIVNVYKRPQESYNFSSASVASSRAVDDAASGKVPGGNMDPVKTIENLVTTTTTMRWNGDGQILAIASKAKRDALRLVHFPSMRVFSNWPTSGTPLGSVSAVDFSPGSQYVAIGNTRGKVLLYSLRHYL
ncbi:hypothetical protein EX895_006070 [Sporisorium graminicola]|uniref:Uncharacterized protein n=1 Tax=Sporisorium graminicola TaxID=280036 RepID=A0A4U7KLB2_9BASI|nr:hypothetical protein EX895_006070 [Sporisorium graminicola]TKY84990.1 hypothetical protein EX895_006070 [Sporisorium graminicola]